MDGATPMARDPTADPGQRQRVDVVHLGEHHGVVLQVVPDGFAWFASIGIEHPGSKARSSAPAPPDGSHAD